MTNKGQSSCVVRFSFWPGLRAPLTDRCSDEARPQACILLSYYIAPSIFGQHFLYWVFVIRIVYFPSIHWVYLDRQVSTSPSPLKSKTHWGRGEGGEQTQFSQWKKNVCMYVSNKTVVAKSRIDAVGLHRIPFLRL